MAADGSDLVFTLVGDDEAGDLATWLAGEAWPFHSRAHCTVAEALASIEDGDFSGTNPTYWVELEDRRIGIVHYRYLGDVSPDADFRLLSPFRGRRHGTRMVEWAAEHLFTTTDKHRLAGETRVDNIAMRRVFERCGWVQEAHYRKIVADGGRRLDGQHRLRDRARRLAGRASLAVIGVCEVEPAAPSQSERWPTMAANQRWRYTSVPTKSTVNTQRLTSAKFESWK
jgi:RimJ/RimL family protein N-acetyltransferase